MMWFVKDENCFSILFCNENKVLLVLSILEILSKQASTIVLWKSSAFSLVSTTFKTSLSIVVISWSTFTITLGVATPQSYSSTIKE